MNTKVLIFLCLVSSQLFGAVLLKDIGVMGLASHDLFTWNKETKHNDENGRLDLSTIFDYEDGDLLLEGGNPKNSENAPVYTITMSLVNEFKKYRSQGMSFKVARKKVVQIFHSLVKVSFQRLTGLSFPTNGIQAEVTNTEQAVMRALHDILPGKVLAYKRKRPLLRTQRNIITLTYLWNAKIYLKPQELNQEINYFNGAYDPEYLEIKVPFKVINLQEVDAAFIEEFSDYNQDEMLIELKRVGDGELKINDVSFIFHMKELFSKAICSDNEWMPEVECE